MSRLGISCPAMEERSGTLRRVIVAIVLATALGCLLAPSALAGKKPKKHVRDTTTWLCKPGVPDNPCEPGFSTTLLSPTGQITGTQDVKADRKRKVDCFYVYPTVSDDKSTNSDLSIDPEERSIALYQAARYSLHCRVFAPMYRQVTLQGLLGTGSTGRSAADRLWRCARRLEDLSAQVQPGPRRGPDRALAGQLRPAGADPPGHRPEDEGAQAPGLGDSAGRQRDRGGGPTSAATSSTSPAASANQTGCVMAFSTFNAPVPDNSHFRATLGRRGARLPTTTCSAPTRRRSAAARPSSRRVPLAAVRARHDHRHRHQPRWRPQPAGVTTPWIERGSYVGACSSDNNAARPADQSGRRRPGSPRGS